MAEEATTEQLKEYEAQLADVDALLQASPADQSLISLKSDLQELLNITKQSLVEKNRAEEPKKSVLDKALELAVETSIGAAVETSSAAVASTENPTASATSSEPPKKKKAKLKDFEIPPHLVPLDSDTEGERNKKRRALKALKSKWRAQKKEAESNKKQKSWQSFQKKKKLNASSMFATSEDGSAKVGVVAGERKRKSR